MGRSTLHIILFHILVTFSIVHLPVLSQQDTNQKDLERGSCTLSDGKKGLCLKSQKCMLEYKYLPNGGEEIIIPKRCGYNGSTEIVCCSLRSYFRVVRGLQVKVAEFPYLAAVAYRNPTSAPNAPQFMYICGGSLISRRHVLTAAHCVRNRDKFIPHHVLLGAIDLIKPGDNAQRIDIAGIVAHPQYRSHLVYKDLAILILKSDAAINNFVAPIRFHVMSLQSTSTEDKVFQAVGFGVTEEEELSTKLLKTHDLRILPQAECQQWYNYAASKISNGIGNTLFCARDVNTSRNSDTCSGDSGGPLIMRAVDGSAPPIVVGITAFGQFCGDLAPTVYTAVYPYLDWIDEIIWKN